MAMPSNSHEGKFVVTTHPTFRNGLPEFWAPMGQVFISLPSTVDSATPLRCAQNDAEFL